MYCFRCGRKLPGREINCPDCDTPQKKRKRRHKRMILGLFIFLSGAFSGSLFDTYVFKGEVWKHSFLCKYFGNLLNADAVDIQSTVASSSVKIEIKHSNAEQTGLTADTSLAGKTAVAEMSSATVGTNSVALTADNVSKDVKFSEVPPCSNTQVIEPKKDDLLESNSSKAPTNEENKLSEAPAMKKEDTTASPSFSKNSTVEAGLDDVIIIEEQEKTLEPVGSYSGDLYAEAVPLVEIPEEGKDEPLTEKNVTVVPNSNEAGYLVYKSLTLLESVNADSYHGFMSNNGKELIFSSNRISVNGKPTFQCFVKSTSEKSTAKRAFKWNGNVWTPELTPDGNIIVFSSDSTKPEHLFLFDRKSGNSMALTSGSSKNMMPSISPDGKKVAFVSNRNDGKNRIWVMDLYNPSKLTQITKGDVNDREPRWAPDGKSIIFTRIKVNMKDSRIMKVDANGGSEPSELVSTSARNWMASLSPNGKILAFTRSLSNGGSHNAIILKDLESSKEEVMTFPGIFDCYRPVWNADSSGFVFHVSKKNGKSIYQANFKRE